MAPVDALPVPLLTQSTSPPRWHPLLVFFAPFLLLSGCWFSGLTSYDDQSHIEVPGMRDIFVPQPEATYFPVTTASYALDNFMFDGWMPQLLGSTAPGRRMMTCVYHAAAALFVWGILRRLGLCKAAALGGALLFGCHPMACETVCWISERKNALAGMCSFAAVWCWLRGARWGLPAAWLLFVLALLSKPSALGMLLVFGALESYSILASRQPASPDDERQTRGARPWLLAALKLLPFALVSLVVLRVNLHSHKEVLVTPPGGSMWTALLTDLDIVAGYFASALAPLRLSTVYHVEPVLGLGDPRVAIYGTLLAAAVALTVWLSPSRLLSLLGWVWIAGGLACNMNIVAISFWKQDRYFYLSSPGFWLVMILAAQGLAARLIPRSSSSGGGDIVAGGYRPAAWRAAALAGALYVVIIIAAGVQRSAVWSSSISIFSDAVIKQPLAAFGHYGLGSAWGEEWQRVAADPASPPQLAPALRQRWLQEWTAAVNCPDAHLFSSTPLMALHAGEFANERQDMAAAERYWSIAIQPSGPWPVPGDIRARALCWLSLLRLAQMRPADAWALADDAVRTVDGPNPRLCRARAALALVKRQRDAAAPAPSAPAEPSALPSQDYLAEAARDLSGVPDSMAGYAEARLQLDSMPARPGAPALPLEHQRGP